MGKYNDDELELKLEAALFSYAKWVSLNELKEVMQISTSQINSLLKKLQKKFNNGFSFHIESNSQNEWRMSLKKEFEHIAQEVISGIEIPKPALKVLSLIAYEQPITKTGLNRLMGRSIIEELEFLYKNKFINYEKKGIGKYYKVTSKFYDYFDLKDREDFLSKANKSLSNYIVEEENVRGENNE